MVGIAWNESRDAVATTCRRSRQGYQVGVKNGQCILIHSDVSQVVVHGREEEPATGGLDRISRTIRKLRPTKTKGFGRPRYRAHVAEIEGLMHFAREICNQILLYSLRRHPKAAL